MHAESFAVDPKHLAFVLARYHFVARMLGGSEYVLEVGCGDCTGARLIQQVVPHWYGIDRLAYSNQGTVVVHDIVRDGPYRHPARPWDAVYSLDVLEHIEPADEATFFANINASLHEHGTVICGLPSLESQPHASKLSREQHVNCKSEAGLRETLERHYHNVYLFGMNDCTLHAGFGPMCHYRFGLACNPRRQNDKTTV